MKRVVKQLATLIAVTVILLSLEGCNEGKASQSQTKSSGDIHVKESPMLTELVAKGELPELEKRIPVDGDAMVEPDVMSLGEYGGTLNMTFHDGAHWKWEKITEQAMFRFAQDGSGKIEPNVAKNFYPNEDATVWTIELRKGMKWSDGEPFTTDDVIFYYDHMSTPALNEDRSPVAPDAEGYYNAFTTKPYRAYYVTVDGTNYWSKFEKIDDYTYTVTFAAPKPNFPEAVALDNKWCFAAKHFYKDLVSRKDGVTDDASFPFITEEEALANANRILGKKFSSYSRMGKSTGYYNWDYYQIPQLRSFIATKNNWDQVGETYELVRNPYFFKTDSEGRQLPYLDSIKIQIINEKEQTILKAMAGELDAYIVQFDEFSTVASSTKDTHRISTWVNPSWGQYTLNLNQTVLDKDKRTLFQNKNFRQALSIAVDRKLLNATLANNQLEPRQASPGEGAFGADEEWANKWIEFDLDKANRILDSLTEEWDGKDGTYRKMKGTDKDLEITIIMDENEFSRFDGFLGLLTSAYKKIGIKILDHISANKAQILLTNEHEADFKGPANATVVLRPDPIVPMRNYMAWYGAYGKWYEDNRSTANGGIAPTGDMLELVKAYERMNTATGSDRDKIIEESAYKIYQLHKENVWVIGYLSAPKYRIFVSNKLMNFPDNLLLGDTFRDLNIARPEQLYKVAD